MTNKNFLLRKLHHRDGRLVDSKPSTHYDNPHSSLDLLPIRDFPNNENKASVSTCRT
jgi:hypothetical protein